MTTGQKKRIETYLNIVKEKPALYQTVQTLWGTGDTEFKQAVYDTVFAPVLISFVEWVLEEAQRRGIKRLYFLARDGYQMFQAAKALCEAGAVDIECRYLYGSRYAWRMPLFALEGDTCLDKLCRGGIDVTFEKVMRRGGLTDAEALTVAEELGRKERYREVLSYNEVMRLKQPLKESKYFLRYVYAHSKEAYKATLGYLKQEGLFDSTKYAIVDSGWTGSMQQTLQRLLQQCGVQREIEGFYFGMYEYPQGVNSEGYHTFYFGPKEGIVRKVYFSNCLYEAVFSAPHGMTVAYEEKDGCYIPVLGNVYSLNQKDMERMIARLEQFLTVYVPLRKEGVAVDSRTGERRQLVYRLLRNFMGTPEKEEAEVYGTLLFSDDVTEDYTQEVAVTLTPEEIKNQRFLNKACIMLGLKKGELHDSAWPEGSIARSGSGVKKARRHAALYKYILYMRKALKK